jgi:predicted nucleotide-binding protein (sugar kinase/HSP70/actin superfamily)
MIVGIPKGLLYWKYYVFIETLLKELEIQYTTSPDTNKDILDAGVKYCVDEACLPIKVFHGHIAYLKDKCDILLVPRVMQLSEREFICPKFCGLPEMIKNSISNLPFIIEEPIYASTEKLLYDWVKVFAGQFTKDKRRIIRAFKKALEEQKAYENGINDTEFLIKVGLLGHPYNIYDNFCNMNIIKKLHSCGIGVITDEFIDTKLINNSISTLFKKPFWTFARKSYGAASVLYENKGVDGLVYISSFACGIDSVVIELIKERIGEFPLLIIKIDEHSGEGGIETRVEAFSDMLERRLKNENKLSESRKLISGS